MISSLQVGSACSWSVPLSLKAYPHLSDGRLHRMKNVLFTSWSILMMKSVTSVARPLKGGHLYILNGKGSSRKNASAKEKGITQLFLATLKQSVDWSTTCSLQTQLRQKALSNFFHICSSTPQKLETDFEEQNQWSSPLRQWTLTHGKHYTWGMFNLKTVCTILLQFPD